MNEREREKLEELQEELLWAVISLDDCRYRVKVDGPQAWRLIGLRNQVACVRDELLRMLESPKDPLVSLYPPELLEEEEDYEPWYDWEHYDAPPRDPTLPRFSYVP